jgi:hypothetical protein
MHIKIFLFFFVFMLNHIPASALGKVSRACRISDIPLPIKREAMVGFEAIGNAPNGSLVALISLPIETQRQYLVLESLTVDFYNRYYLFSEANITQSWYPNLYDNARTYKVKYASPGFETQSWSAELKNYLNSSASQFSFNRKILFSSRAGHSNIVQYWPNPVTGFLVWYEVIGRHFYYDPESKVQQDMGYSKANDCNLSDWGNGLQYSIADR